MIAEQVKDVALEAEVIKSLGALQGVLTEWQHFLGDGVQGNNLFNDPAHIELRLRTENHTIPWIVILRRGGRIRCIAPCYLCDGPFVVQLSVVKLASFRAKQLKIFGDDFIVALEEDTKVCFDLIFETLRRQPTLFQFVLIDKLIAETPLWEYCQANCHGDRGFRLYLASPQLEKLHKIRIEAEHDHYMASLSPKTRQNLRRTARKLCEDHQARLERITAPEQVPRFLEQLDEVFRDTWQAKTFGYQPRNTDAQLRYLHSIAQLGWLRSYLLSNDQGPIAYDLAFQYGDTFYAEEIGFAQAWADYGPGSVLMHLFIEDLHHHQPPKHLDFGVGDAPYKRSFSNFEQVAASVFLVPRNRWRLIMALQRGLNAVDRNVRKVLIALKLDRVVRKLLKRQH